MLHNTIISRLSWVTCCCYRNIYRTSRNGTGTQERCVLSLMVTLFTWHQLTRYHLTRYHLTRYHLTRGHALGNQSNHVKLSFD